MPSTLRCAASMSRAKSDWEIPTKLRKARLSLAVSHAGVFSANRQAQVCSHFPFPPLLEASFAASIPFTPSLHTIPTGFVSSHSVLNYLRLDCCEIPSRAFMVMLVSMITHYVTRGWHILTTVIGPRVRANDFMLQLAAATVEAPWRLPGALHLLTRPPPQIRDSSVGAQADTASGVMGSTCGEGSCERDQRGW